MNRRLSAMLVTAIAAAPLALSQVTTPAAHQDGTHASGARWAVDMPAIWNGTLLLYGRGYTPTLSNAAPETAPRGMREWLLEHGYALAASSYSAAGWALAEAPGDQIDALDEFTQRYGKPKRTIAWGSSMGGLTTLAIAERYPGRIDGALPICGSVSGSLGMLNTALDGAFAFRTLLAADSDIRVVNVDDDLRNGARVRQSLEAALRTPQGRARVALAATLAQIPPWTDPKAIEPAAADYTAQAEELYKSFVMGVFLPRVDQEKRAGGVYSWNTGIDYRKQLQLSGRSSFVRAMYRSAGQDLDADLATLKAAPRIAALPQAVAYMRANYVPTGSLGVPVLTMQTVGDGLTVPATHGSLRDTVRAAGHDSQLAQLYVRGAGHCTFTLNEQVVALKVLEQKLDSGRWSISPAQLAKHIAAIGRDAGTGEARFTEFRPSPLLRSCGATRGSCAGEPELSSAAVAATNIDGVVSSSQYVRVRDGTRLAVQLFRPASSGVPRAETLPVVLLHATGLRPTQLNARTAELGVDALVRRGYVVAWMEPRGYGASFGAATPFLTRQNGRDAADVVEWLATQAWSTGRIAMLGLSNMGLIQWLTAVERPPHLVAMAPSVATPNFYYQLYPNGVSALAGAPTRAGAGPKGVPVDEDRGTDFPLNTAANAAHAGNRMLQDEWLTNMARDQFNPLMGYAPGLEDSIMPTHTAAVRAAGLQIFQHAGWYDSSPSGQLAAWKAFGGRITIGAWRHGLYAASEGGALIRSELLSWFDQVLQGVPATAAALPPIHYQTINATGDAQWHYASSWPLANQKLTDYHLLAGTHQLATKPPARGAVGADSCRIDPNLVAFDGKFNRLARQWNGDMASLDARGLSYTSEPLADDTEVTGHPVAHLWLSADAPDVNVLVYLEDVDSTGRSTFVTDGVMRASHRSTEQRSPWKELGIPFHPGTQPQLKSLVSGVPVELNFDLHPTSYLFRRGSRLRVTITGAERNTYEQPAGFDVAAPPTFLIYSESGRDSRVVLPVIPSGHRGR
jgi:putative CocE/NonD family hydrolase